MDTFKTKDPNAVKAIIGPIVKYFEKEEIKDYEPEHLLKWLRYNIGNPMIGVWICIDNDETKGFAIAMMQAGLDREYVIVSHIYAEVPEIESDFLQKIEDWSRKYGIQDIRAITKHPKRWKDYGYVVSEHILRREL